MFLKCSPNSVLCQTLCQTSNQETKILIGDLAFDTPLSNGGRGAGAARQVRRTRIPIKMSSLQDVST